MRGGLGGVPTKGAERRELLVAAGAAMAVTVAALGGMVTGLGPPLCV